MAKLVVTRKKQLQSALIPLAINVDGIEQKGLRSGGKIEMEILPGQHQFRVGNQGALYFDNSAGNETHIEVWISTWSSKGKARITS